MSENNSQPNGNPEHGYVLNFLPENDAVQHEFCGAHQIGGAVCPYCNKPLVRILSFNAIDPALDLNQDEMPFVPLLYCWTCSIPYGEFSYKIKPDGSIEIVQIPERQPDSEFGLEGPYDGYSGIYPLRFVSLQPMNDDDDAKLALARVDAEYDHDGDLFEPRHQVGGSPFIYNPQTLTCPSCLRAMPIIATICNDATGNDPWKKEDSSTFAGNGGVQMVFQLCRDCAIVSAYHSCD